MRSGIEEWAAGAQQGRNELSEWRPHVLTEINLEEAELRDHSGERKTSDSRGIDNP